MNYQTFNTANGLSLGDTVRKIQTDKHSTKFVGKLLAIYNVPTKDEQYCVVELQETEYSSALQHLYPLKFFEKV